MDRIGSQQPLGYDNSVGARVKKDLDAVKDGVQTALDVFVPGSNYSSVEINTDIPEYKNVTTEEAAKMIGYFTQIMEQKGFPWALYEPKTGLFGIKSKKAIGEFEALKRIEKGQPVIFHPLRVIGLGFNAPELKNKHLSDTDQKGKFDMNSGGMETSFGVPIEIKNKAELKFLYELYNPEAKAKDAPSGSFKEAAGELAFFTTGTMAGQHPWKLYKDEGKMKNFLRMAAGAIKSGGIGAAIGMAAFSVFSLPALAILPIGGAAGIATGAAVGGAIGAFKGAFAKRKGVEINAFEALARLSNNEPVSFQEKKKREIGISVPFPVNVQLGSLSFYSDHGEGSVISDFKDLKLFHEMQAQQIQNPDENKNKK